MPGFDMKDYVDVAERVAEFSRRYPEGSLQSELKPQLDSDGMLVGWLCRAYAYRTPDDTRPGIGHAVEPVPGKTPYTRDSEAMNAETSAWGRAIVALGFPTKKIASQQEVAARQEPASGSAGPAKRARKPEAEKAVSGPAAGTQEAGAPQTPSGTSPSSAVDRDNQDVPEAWSQFATKDQRQQLFELKRELGVSDVRLMEILEYVTGQKTTAAIPAGLFDKVMENVQLEAVPFT
jgi:hypothetical protein